MKGWTSSDIDKINARTKKAIEPTSLKALPGSKKQPNAIKHIANVLKEYNLEFEQEKRFMITRRFRFDFAVESEKIAVEYEGIFAASGSGKSRHTTQTGYSQDAEKYNAATAKGWKVFRYTELNYNNFELDLLRYFYLKFKK